MKDILRSTGSDVCAAMRQHLASPVDPAMKDISSSIRQAACDWKARMDAGAGPGEERELQAWLEADPRHRAAMARTDLVWKKLDRLVQGGATDQLLQELEIRACRRRRRRVISVAAGVCLLIAVASGWRFVAPEFSRRDTIAAESTPASNAVLLLPERRTLPDGSIAELRGDAEIAIEFTAEVRRVALRRGEAHFQVRSIPGRPFVVSAGGVEARAVGTAFTVGLRSVSVEVLVTEGRVAVTQTVPPVSPSQPRAANQPDAATEPTALLDVGKSIVVDLAAPTVGLPPVTAVDPEELAERLAWRAPRVEFSRTSLSEAIAVMNGYSAGQHSAGNQGVQFIIGDSALASVRVSGLFRVDRTDAFIGLLKSGFGIEAERRGDHEIVLRFPR